VGTHPQHQECLSDSIATTISASNCSGTIC